MGKVGRRFYLKDKLTRIFRVAVNKWQVVNECYKFTHDALHWEINLHQNLKDDELHYFVASFVGGCSANPTGRVPVHRLVQNFVKSFYQLIDGNRPAPLHLGRIWKVKAPLKVKACTWLFSERKIMMSMYHSRWAVYNDMCCIFCSQASETVDELFFQCD